MRKKLFALLVSMLMIFASLPLAALAAEPLAYDSISVVFYYIDNDDYIVIVEQHVYDANELLEYHMASNRGFSDDDYDTLIQNLIEASLRGDPVFVTDFIVYDSYYYNLAAATREPIYHRYGIFVWARAFAFHNSAIWQIASALTVDASLDVHADGRILRSNPSHPIINREVVHRRLTHRGDFIQIGLLGYSNWRWWASTMVVHEFGQFSIHAVVMNPFYGNPWL